MLGLGEECVPDLGLSLRLLSILNLGLQLTQLGFVRILEVKKERISKIPDRKAK